MTAIGDHLYARSTRQDLLSSATNGAFVTTAMWYLLSTKQVDAVLGVARDKERNLTHARFIDDPREIAELAGTVVTAPLNIVQTLRKYGGSGRIALPVMPCEEKLLDVLIRKNELPVQLFRIGLVCGGLFNATDLSREVKRLGKSLLDVERVIHGEGGYFVSFAGETEIHEFAERSTVRQACERCVTPEPISSHFSCGYWGTGSDRSRTYVTVNTAEGAELVDAMVRDGALTVEPVPDDARAIRQHLLELKTAASWRYRRRQFETDLVEMADQVGTCPLCGECMKACPLRTEEYVQHLLDGVKSPAEWITAFVLDLYEECAECGLCSEHCPITLPYDLVIEHQRELRKTLPR
jgi:coenzyme F420-reducing hydrogenase beta subunit